MKTMNSEIPQYNLNNLNGQYIPPAAAGAASSGLPAAGSSPAAQGAGITAPYPAAPASADPGPASFEPSRIDPPEADDGNQKPKKSKLVTVLMVIAAVLSVIILLLVIIIFVPRRGSRFRVIKVEDYDGKVAVRRKKEPVDISKGIQLETGDRVSTGKSSWLAMLIDSDKHIGATAETVFFVEATGNEKKGSVTIKLKKGSAVFSIDNKLSDKSTFEVITPNASLSVKGTTFNVSYNPDTDTTRITVTEGTVTAKYGDGEKKKLNAGDSGFITYDEFSDIEKPAFIITRIYSRSAYDTASPVSIRFAYTMRGNEHKSIWDVEMGTAVAGNDSLAKEAFDTNISCLLPHEEEIKEYMSSYTLDRLNQPAPDLPGDGGDVSGWYLDTFSYGNGDEEDVTEWFPKTLSLHTESGEKTFHIDHVVMWTQVFDENITDGIVGEAYIKELGFGFYGYSE